MRKLVLAAIAATSIGLTAPTIAQARYCSPYGGISIDANRYATCPFARNIARSFYNGVQNGNIDPVNNDWVRGRAYSPTNRRWYSYRCTHNYDRSFEGTDYWSCRAGNSAWVFLTYYS